MYIFLTNEEQEINNAINKVSRDGRYSTVIFEEIYCSLLIPIQPEGG